MSYKFGVEKQLNCLIDELLTNHTNHLASKPHLQILKFSNHLIFNNPFHYPHLMGISFGIDIENSKLIDIIDSHLT